MRGRPAAAIVLNDVERAELLILSVLEALHRSHYARRTVSGGSIG